MNSHPGRGEQALPFEDVVFEASRKPGVVHQLKDIAARVTEQWGNDYADPYGWIHLRGSDDTAVSVQKIGFRGSEQIVNPTPQETAAIGLRRIVQFFRNEKPCIYNVSFASDDISIIELSLALRSTDDIRIVGKRFTYMEDNTDTTTLYTGLDLEENIKYALDALNGSFPESPDAVVAERQQHPCAEITGTEAMAVQTALEPVIRMATDAPLGLRHAAQSRTAYQIIRPKIDGQWSVESMSILQGGVPNNSNVRNIRGQSIQNIVYFSSQTINEIEGDILATPLIVNIEGVYEHNTDSLAGTYIRYFTASEEDRAIPVAVGPAERTAIHTAIANQLTPDNLKPAAQ